MSTLLRTVKKAHPEAAAVLEEAGLCSDLEIRSVTRSELLELFPGHSKLKLRRAIFELIHQQRPAEMLLSELKEFIPHESVKAALTSNGVLVEYLHILKDTKTQVDNIQCFLDAHIGFLENLCKDQSDNKSDKGSLSGTSNCCDPVVPPNSQSDGHPQGAQEITDTFVDLTHSSPLGAQVIYQTFVSGKTMGVHEHIMSNVIDVVQHLNSQVELIEKKNSNNITIVFCPVVSRIGADISAAMSQLDADTPVILVLLHHERQPKTITSARTWCNQKKVVLCANIFFHDTVLGLLPCKENGAAFFNIAHKLLEYSKNVGMDKVSHPDPGKKSRAYSFFDWIK